MNVYKRQEKQILWQVRKLNSADRLSLALTGMVGELYEAKEARHNLRLAKSQEPSEITLEVGDFLWYVHLMCLLIGDNFESQIHLAAHDLFGFQYVDPLMHLGPLSEMTKKVAITKKKTLDEFRTDAATHIHKLLVYVGGFQPISLKSIDWYEAVIKANYDKLVVRHGEPGEVNAR